MSPTQCFGFIASSEDAPLERGNALEAIPMYVLILDLRLFSLLFRVSMASRVEVTTNFSSPQAAPPPPDPPPILPLQPLAATEGSAPVALASARSYWGMGSVPPEHRANGRPLHELSSEARVPSASRRHDDYQKAPRDAQKSPSISSPRRDIWTRRQSNVRVLGDCPLLPHGQFSIID